MEEWGSAAWGNRTLNLLRRSEDEFGLRAASAARRRFGQTYRRVRASKSAVAASLCRRSPYGG